MYSFYLVYLVVNHQIPRDLLFNKSYFKINIVNILFQTIYNQYIYIYITNSSLNKNEIPHRRDSS